jgi:hypothetical protein
MIISDTFWTRALKIGKIRQFLSKFNATLWFFDQKLDVQDWIPRDKAI